MAWTKSFLVHPAPQKASTPFSRGRSKHAVSIYKLSAADDTPSTDDASEEAEAHAPSFTIEYRFGLIKKSEMRLFQGHGPDRLLLATAVQDRQGGGNSTLTLLETPDGVPLHFKLRRRSGFSTITYTLCFDSGKAESPEKGYFEWRQPSFDEVQGNRELRGTWILRASSESGSGVQEDGRKLPVEGGQFWEENLAVYADASASLQDTGKLYLYRGEKGHVDETWLRTHLISVLWMQQMM